MSVDCELVCKRPINANYSKNEHTKLCSTRQVELVVVAVNNKNAVKGIRSEMLG